MLKFIAAFTICSGCMDVVEEYCDANIRQIEVELDDLTGNCSLDVYSYYYLLGQRDAYIDVKKRCNHE